MFINTQCDLKSYVNYNYVEIKLCLLPKVKEKSTVEGLSRLSRQSRDSQAEITDEQWNSDWLEIRERINEL